MSAAALSPERRTGRGRGCISLEQGHEVKPRGNRSPEAHWGPRECEILPPEPNQTPTVPVAAKPVLLQPF